MLVTSACLGGTTRRESLHDGWLCHDGYHSRDSRTRAEPPPVQSKVVGVMIGVVTARTTKLGDETASLHGGLDASELCLVICSPHGERRCGLAGRARVVLGRGAECDIVLDDPAVSRRHVAVILSGIPHLEDLGSRNGTVLFGRTLHEGDRSPLPIGTAFSVGEATVVLVRRTDEKVRAAEPVLCDPIMLALYSELDVIGRSSLSVLILGETGTGKEVFAESVHARSPRAARLFLPVNCAALSGSLLESELFGHERGAFTGALQAKLGLFEAANGGTIFLDEIGELALSTQAKLLRVLETGEVTRLGSVKPRRVDVRFIAATNRALEEEVESGLFRRDLLYRLNGFTVRLPPLRDRPLDVIPLAELFLERAARQMDCMPPRLSEDARAALLAHSWPGNVRELRNAVERSVSVSRGAAMISARDLALTPTLSSPRRPTPTPVQSPRVYGPRLTKQDVLEALGRTSHNQKEAAKLLGVSRRTLINKMVLFGIQRPRKKAQ
jgi:two-component system, NtrC family, response regulator AtoC